MTKHDPDSLDRLLAERPMSDDGFTDRVMTRLPPRRRPVPRALVLGGAAMLGTLIAALSPGSRRIAAMMQEVLASREALTTHTTTVLVLAAIVGAGAQIATPD
jgi:hypothetical protein